MIPICTDDQGNWGGADASFVGAFGRIRIEVDPGDGNFVPLIDGPVVGSDQSMSSEPGQSTITAVVNVTTANGPQVQPLRRDLPCAAWLNQRGNPRLPELSKLSSVAKVLQLKRILQVNLPVSTPDLRQLSSELRDTTGGTTHELRNAGLRMIARRKPLPRASGYEPDIMLE